MACRLTFITLGCYAQYNVMFICVLTELSINSEKNNKRSQVKKIKRLHLGKYSISDTPFDQNLHFCFLLFGLSIDGLSVRPLHTHTYKNSHTNKHTQTFGTEE